MENRPAKFKKDDLKLTEEEAMAMINRYNNAYDEYRKLKNTSVTENVDDSDSGSSKLPFIQ
jgi:hypothetical protein